jgi:hypothetical protein
MCWGGRGSSDPVCILQVRQEWHSGLRLLGVVLVDDNQDFLTVPTGPEPLVTVTSEVGAGEIETVLLPGDLTSDNCTPLPVDMAPSALVIAATEGGPGVAIAHTLREELSGPPLLA